MPSSYYDMDGNSISFEKCGELWDLKCEKKYGIIKQERFGNLYISTVWLGIDHNFVSFIRENPEESKPILFETMVFSDDEKHDVYMERYSTKEEALQGHNRVMEILKKEGLDGL